MKLLSLLVVSISVATGAYAQSCKLRLSGHVEDADTRETLAGATVILMNFNKEIITDEKGDFIFDSLCAGQYVLNVSHVNCDPVGMQITLDKDRHLDIFLPHAQNTLGQVLVEARKGTPNTGLKKELSGRQLEQTKGLSFSEALSKLNGVTLLQTGSTIAKPVIHGLHSNRILTINNGVRQEGQQWGNEHAPEIDPFIADKLTVIKGVDELRYGSDAIGGVILVQPKPLQNKPGWQGEFNSAYFTNNRQYVVSGVFEQQLKKLPAFAYRIQGTFKKGANAATPHYRLNNTASEEKNFSITAGWNKKKLSSELFYSRFATKLGIFNGSHIGNLSDLQNAIAADRPNDVFLGQDSYEIYRPYQDVTHQLLKSKTQLTKNGHRFTLQLAGQFNKRKEFDIVRSSDNTKPQLNLSISTLSEDLTWEQPRHNYFNGTFGISAMQQDNAYAGRYFIPNYRSNTTGVFAIEKWSRHKWEAQAGIRFDHKNINTNRLLSGGTSFDHYTFRFSTLASSINIGFKPSTQWQMNGAASLSSRAPQVNELLSNGIHHGTATYEEGDIHLSPEKSFNLSANIQYSNLQQTVTASLYLYSNTIHDFIFRQPVPGEPVLTIAGAFPKIQYRQTDAVLNGMDVSMSIKPINWLDWNTSLSILRARNKTAGDWLILMPSDRLKSELDLTLKDGKHFIDTYFSIEVTHVFEQTRTPSKNGPEDYKEPPGAYTLVNCRFSTKFSIKKQPAIVSIGVNNLFDTAYREYLNSMRFFTDEMGRNISFRLTIPIHQDK